MSSGCPTESWASICGYDNHSYHVGYLRSFVVERVCGYFTSFYFSYIAMALSYSFHRDLIFIPHKSSLLHPYAGKTLFLSMSVACAPFHKMAVHIGGIGAGLATNIHAIALLAKTYGYGLLLVP